MAKSVITIPATKSKYTATPLSCKKKRKVAAYARVSTDHEEQQSSYEAQVDYYTTYIGSCLERQQGSVANLSYSESVGYDDLRILFQICNEKGIEPLFVHVPMHGQWSDYTGFTADRRQQYYENVRQIADE